MDLRKPILVKKHPESAPHTLLASSFSVSSDKYSSSQVLAANKVTIWKDFRMEKGTSVASLVLRTLTTPSLFHF
jgi:hypothetical protein